MVDMYDVLVFIAGPLSKGNIDANIKKQTEASIRLLQEGIPNVCSALTCFTEMKRLTIPMKMTPEGLEDLQINAYLPNVHVEGVTIDHWYQSSLAIVKRCDALLVMPSLENSQGVFLEVQQACGYNKPIFYNVGDVIEAVKMARESGFTRLVSSP